MRVIRVERFTFLPSDIVPSRQSNGAHLVFGAKFQAPHFFRPCILRVNSSVFTTLLSRVSCAPINSHLLYGGGDPTGASARNINRTRSLRYVRDRVTNGGRG